MSQTLLQALFEVQRQNVILAKLNPQTSDYIDNALVFAYSARLCPVLHTDSAAEDPFNEAWRIPRAFVDHVFTYCDDRWHRKERVNFGTDLEGKFGRDERGILIKVMRYFFLADHFRPFFWKGLLYKAPSESKGITRPFKLNEISL